MKGQVRIGETIAILFIFMVMIILGFTFYAKLQQVSIGATTEKTEDARAIEVATRASFLAELQCSSKNIVTHNCFDIYKLQAFTAVADPQAYVDDFLTSVITVEQIYPPGPPPWTLYDVPGDGSSLRTPVPILLYDTTTRKFAAGLLTIDYYPVSVP